MKRIITLIAILAFSVAANAQTDSLVTILPQDDGINLNIAGFSVTLAGKNEQKKEKSRFRPYGTNVCGIKWGVAQMTDAPYYGRWNNMGDFLNLSGKSSSITIEPVSWHVGLDRRRITWIQMGINCTWDNYHFFNPNILVNDADGRLMPLVIEGDLKKNKLYAFYLGASLGLAFRIGNVKLGANVIPEVLCYSESVYKFKGKKQDNIRQEVQGMNPVRVKVGATMMFDWFGIYMDYSLSPVFKEGMGNDGHLTSIGIKLGF